MDDTPVWSVPPTPFPDLNAVLRVLVAGARACLGTTFLGAYLQGSFAVGDADANSDCDFIVVVRRDLTDAEREGLDRLHTSIHDLPQVPWRHRLEGSYAPADILRAWSPTPRDPPGEPRPADWADPGTSGSPPRVYPFFYLDHGAKTLVRSEHDNTLVVRWSLRERGIVLAGPDPKELVDPIDPAALRAEVREVMARAAATNLEPIDLIFWQSFWVGLYCRMLCTFETGAVASKRVSSAWALASLEPRWRGLIERAQAVRDGDRSLAMTPAAATDVAETFDFVHYAMDRARRQNGLLSEDPQRHRL